jgi:ppGpp synthetase/RelA/SpoT-type nucleotidyltranferase
MVAHLHVSFPGGSKSRVNRAGDNLRNNAATADDLRIIDEWRAAHRAVLNTFQAILRTRTRATNQTRATKIVVAQRHKRKSTIYGKLERYPEMKLSRMDDVAGCRLIFENIRDLYTFRNIFHTARFNHVRRNDVDKYDYIKRPKSTGYRGIHDVYEYDVRSMSGQALKGLLVEIQYRTLIQHAWATAVEVIGFITESQPKFEQGDTRYQHAMALASEILAREFEQSNGPFPSMKDRDLVRNFLAADKDISLLNMLRSLNAADTEVSANRNTILIVSKSGELDVRTFRDAPEALRTLFELEKESGESDIVLVRADTSEEVRLAFRNYFSDARDFIRLVETGCQHLSGQRAWWPATRRTIRIK